MGDGASLAARRAAGHIGHHNSRKRGRRLMADELVLYTNPRSRGRIARWMLEEVGEPYRTEALDYNTSMKAAPYLAINPMGKVPAVRHGDVVITEAAAICAYLADAFPQAKLAPPSGDRMRAPYYRWMFFAAGPLEAAASNKALGFTIPSEREGYLGYGNFNLVMNVLEAAVSSSNYLAGDTFTAADVYVGSHIGFGLMFGTFEKRPAFERYLQRLSARAAYKRARELDDELISQEQKAAS
jgi:glutathione S-transferase